jgi:glyoxylase-like metal-dependent hydrolase (beta-lactamase superfamily II)/ferredoxin
VAHAERKLAENSPGEWFVDDSCIDCGACRNVAPAVFAQSARGFSYVASQPEGESARERAAMALVACPTSSIGGGTAPLVRRAAGAFPEVVESDVWYCGYHAAESYGASSYLIRRPEGNVLVDSPRAAKPLLARLEALGGVRYLFLTHRDDVAFHQVFRDRFGCERIMHESDISRGTRGIERPLRGSGAVALADDLLLIPVPGHTRGSTALLYRNEFLFSGDHLSYASDEGALDAHRGVCWYSWSEQVRSVERLLEHPFRWLLPGHGESYRAASPEAMRGMIETWLGSNSPRHDRSQ